MIKEPMKKKDGEIIIRLLATLHQTYPHLHHYLNFSNPLELLVATILSAQVRDEIVNTTTPALFAKYRKAEDYANADLQTLISMVKTITFSATKAKHIKESCTILRDKYMGNVPQKMEELIELPGIGRKSANAILQNAYNKVEGIIVDTHVLRVPFRLGLTTTDKNAEKAERELMEILPKAEWKEFPWLMKSHGRAVCKAPTPTCSACPVEKLCPKNNVTKKF